MIKKLFLLIFLILTSIFSTFTQESNFNGTMKMSDQGWEYAAIYNEIKVNNNITIPPYELYNDYRAEIDFEIGNSLYSGFIISNIDTSCDHKFDIHISDEDKDIIGYIEKTFNQDFFFIKYGENEIKGNMNIVPNRVRPKKYIFEFKYGDYRITGEIIVKFEKKEYIDENVIIFEKKEYNIEINRKKIKGFAEKKGDRYIYEVNYALHADNLTNEELFIFFFLEDNILLTNKVNIMYLNENAE